MNFAECALGVFNVLWCYFQIGKWLTTFNSFVGESYIDRFSLTVFRLLRRAVVSAVLSGPFCNRLKSIHLSLTPSTFKT